jgi:hypothetical protein
VAQYRFVTEFAAAAPIAAVYATIVEPERWLAGWGDAVRVRRLRTGDVTGAGAAFEATVRAPVGYRVSARIDLTETDPPTHVRMRASGGLEGEGRWRLRARGELTEVAFAWTVRTTATWMNLAAPVARPLFEWSHGVVVRRAAEAAAAHLGTELASFRSRAERPHVHRDAAIVAAGIVGAAALVGVLGRVARRD